MGYIQEQEMGSHVVDFGEGEVTVHFRRMNLFEMDLVEKAATKGSVDAVVESVMLRSRTEAGVTMFQKSDRSKIIRQFDPEAVMSLVAAMNAFDAEGALGN